MYVCDVCEMYVCVCDCVCVCVCSCPASFRATAWFATCDLHVCILACTVCAYISNTLPSNTLLSNKLPSNTLPNDKCHNATGQMKTPFISLRKSRPRLILHINIGSDEEEQRVCCKPLGTPDLGHLAAVQCTPDINSAFFHQTPRLFWPIPTALSYWALKE